MSIFIILIHVGYSYQCVILRVAVPIFFILSSFFFFNKIQDCKTWQDIKPIYILFLKRSMKLYFFWFVVLFPITYILRDWSNLSFLQFCLTVIKGALFDSTFPASWYISAYIIGISIILFLRRFEIFTIFISVVLYIICCLYTNYYGICQVILGGVNHYLSECCIYNSFPVGLIFIYMGKCFSKYHKYHTSSLRFWCFICMMFSFVLLILENSIINKLNCRLVDDCYFSLLLFAPCTFLWVKSLSNVNSFIVVKTYLRKMSTIYYCTHIVILRIIKYINHSFDKLECFFITLLICTIISCIIFYIVNYNKSSVLKYSY